MSRAHILESNHLGLDLALSLTALDPGEQPNPSVPISFSAKQGKQEYPPQRTFVKIKSVSPQNREPGRVTTCYYSVKPRALSSEFTSILLFRGSTKPSPTLAQCSRALKGGMEEGRCWESG